MNRLPDTPALAWASATAPPEVIHAAARADHGACEQDFACPNPHLALEAAGFRITDQITRADSRVLETTYSHPDAPVTARDLAHEDDRAAHSWLIEGTGPDGPWYTLTRPDACDRVPVAMAKAARVAHHAA